MFREYRELGGFAGCDSDNQLPGHDMSLHLGGLCLDSFKISFPFRNRDSKPKPRYRDCVFCTQ